LQYVVDFLSDYYQQAFAITSNQEKFLASSENKINYSHEKLGEEEIYIHPYSLLFETGKRNIVVESFEQNGYRAFFKTEGTFGFDIFAAIFFLLSRYEEYLPHLKDEYGRYDHKNSSAYKEGFLHQPLINIWLEDFRKVLLQKDASFINHHSFSFTPTYDIDIAWSYLNKGRKRTIGGFARDIIKGQWWYVKKRWKVLRKKERDPFDVYEWLDELHEQNDLNPVYFFPVAEKSSKYDKNISPKDENYRALIKQNAAKYSIGVHPSWQSGDQPYLLTKEIQTLQNSSGQNIVNSRQHFIRLSLPETYRRLITLGITNEYSMGYGSINGFRASITTSFYWYDLEREEKTSLLIHPFCFMDANSFFEQKFTPEQALDEAIKYYREVKKVNGNLITIWHPPFLGTDRLFAGWKEVYEQLIRNITT
jgi:hypothetical protein